MTKLKMLVQKTPNPNALKFVVNVDVKTEGKVGFDDAAKCDHVPVAQELLCLPNVTQVHFFENVITVTQDGAADWTELREMIEGTLYSLLPDHDPNFPTPEENRRQNLSPDMLRIEEVLDSAIRPYLQGDGGDLEVVSLEDKVLSIRYEGACGTCPSSVAGTLQAIQSVIRDEIDPEMEVVAL